MDIRDRFGGRLLNPATALSSKILVFKIKDNGLPTLDLHKAIKENYGQPILFKAIYSSSSYRMHDLIHIFSYAMTKCITFYKENYEQINNKPNLINDTRVSMVDLILNAA